MNELLTLEAPASGYAMPERQESFGAEVDLASRWLGGSVLAASDESFGEKEALLTPTPSAFVPCNYGPRGEIVDGWETRRRREAGLRTRRAAAPRRSRTGRTAGPAAPAGGCLQLR